MYNVGENDRQSVKPYLEPVKQKIKELEKNI